MTMTKYRTTKAERKELGSRLKMARLQAGLTQEEAAERSGLGLAPNSVWRYEDGRCDVSAGWLWAFAKLYGKPIGWFFGETQADISGADLTSHTKEILRLTRNLPVRDQLKVLAVVQALLLPIEEEVPVSRAAR